MSNRCNPIRSGTFATNRRLSEQLLKIVKKHGKSTYEPHNRTTRLNTGYTNDTEDKLGPTRKRPDRKLDFGNETGDAGKSPWVCFFLSPTTTDHHTTKHTKHEPKSQEKQPDEPAFEIHGNLGNTSYDRQDSMDHISDATLMRHSAEQADSDITTSRLLFDENEILGTSTQNEDTHSTHAETSSTAFSDQESTIEANSQGDNTPSTKGDNKKKTTQPAKTRPTNPQATVMPNKPLAPMGPTNPLAPPGPTNLLAVTRPTKILAHQRPTNSLAHKGPNKTNHKGNQSHLQKARNRKQNSHETPDPAGKKQIWTMRRSTPDGGNHNGKKQTTPQPVPPMMK